MGGEREKRERVESQRSTGFQTVRDDGSFPTWYPHEEGPGGMRVRSCIAPCWLVVQRLPSGCDVPEGEREGKNRKEGGLHPVGSCLDLA